MKRRETYQYAVTNGQLSNVVFYGAFVGPCIAGLATYRSLAV